MKIALVVGHSSKSTGAHNKELDITEYSLNEIEAKKVSELLDDRGVENVVIYRQTYKDLPAKINKEGADIVLCFHHNSFDEKSTGTETLYYHKSKKGKVFAEIMQKNIVDALGFKDRGIKPKASEDRGGYVLKYTNAPCLIMEPCFMSNTKELQKFMDNLNKYCEAVVRAIELL